MEWGLGELCYSNAGNVPTCSSNLAVKVLEVRCIHGLVLSKAFAQSHEQEYKKKTVDAT